MFKKMINRLKRWRNMKNKFMCDFETNNFIEDCRVWSWGAYDIYKEGFVWNTDIRSFFPLCRAFLPVPCV